MSIGRLPSKQRHPRGVVGGASLEITFKIRVVVVIRSAPQ